MLAVDNKNTQANMPLDGSSIALAYFAPPLAVKPKVKGSPVRARAGRVIVVMNKPRRGAARMDAPAMPTPKNNADLASPWCTTQTNSAVPTIGHAAGAIKAKASISKIKPI